ncbi:MAG: hypothetical protein ACRC36_21080 [Lacrimispora sphenoides]|uniref:Uncharacterized protein n=1 Tax=[Clostridium] celerecrescens 18A TaxID=1286362 RepID=A0A2M8Z2T8_9FIRM|nr:hypothetical protein H171_1228 [[Clostridium] celerecrescens 18A]
MDAESLIRITEFLHALKILLAATKRLKVKDWEHLKKIAELLEKWGKI